MAKKNNKPEKDEEFNKVIKDIKLLCQMVSDGAGKITEKHGVPFVLVLSIFLDIMNSSLGKIMDAIMKTAESKEGEEE